MTRLAVLQQVLPFSHVSTIVAPTSNSRRARLIHTANTVQVEKLLLLEDNLDDELLKAFSEYELKDIQFGLDWLTNLAEHALDAHDMAVIFIVRQPPKNLLAYPMRLNHRTRQAHSLSTFYTSNHAPIVRGKRTDTLFNALFRHLAQVEKVTAINLSPLAAQTPYIAMIENALRATGWRGVHSYFCFGNWTHDIEGATYETYLASRPSRVRNTVKRKTRQFLAQGRGGLELVNNSHELESYIEKYVAVYNASWKKEEPYPDFVPQLLRLGAARGWLRLGMANYDNTPVASQIWLIHGGCAYIFKLAYHEDYKQLSAGTVLTAFMMQHIIDTDAVTRIDYLSGDDSYKKDWMSKRGERHGIAAYNPRTLYGLGMLAARALNAAKKKIMGAPAR